MTTAVLTNTILDPSGTPQTGITITAVLMPGVGFRADNTEVGRYESTTTNGSGEWSLTLERNDQITPTGTYWLVTEKVNAPQGPAVWACSVTGNSTLLASLIVPLSAASGEYGLTQEAADARYYPQSDVDTFINDIYTSITDLYTQLSDVYTKSVSDSRYYSSTNKSYLRLTGSGTGIRPTGSTYWVTLTQNNLVGTDAILSTYSDFPAGSIIKLVTPGFYTIRGSLFANGGAAAFDTSQLYVSNVSNGGLVHDEPYDYIATPVPIGTIGGAAYNLNWSGWVATANTYLSLWLNNWANVLAGGGSWSGGYLEINRIH